MTDWYVVTLPKAVITTRVFFSLAYSRFVQMQLIVLCLSQKLLALFKALTVDLVQEGDQVLFFK